MLSPWSKSQFLSHAFHLLSEREEFTYMTEYMTMTKELGQYAEGHRKLIFNNYESSEFTFKNVYSASKIPASSSAGYTLFVPRDDAFWRLFVQDATAPDPFILDDEFRLRTLLGHVAVGRFFSKDMRDGMEIEMVGGKKLKVVKDNKGEYLGSKQVFRNHFAFNLISGVISLNDGRQVITLIKGGNETYVYNLGNVFYVDKVLFTETSDVVNVMVKNEKSAGEREELEDKNNKPTLLSIEDFKEDFGGGGGGKKETENSSVESSRLEDSPRATRDCKNRWSKKCNSN